MMYYVEVQERGDRRDASQSALEGEIDHAQRVAQAISETLPLESKEKKLLDGFLAGRDRVQQEVEKSAEQGKFF